MSKEKYLVIILMVLLSWPYQARAMNDPEPDSMGTNSLVLEYHRNNLTLSLIYNGQREIVETNLTELNITADSITLPGQVVFQAEKLRWKDITIPYELLKRVAIDRVNRKWVRIEFKIRESSAKTRVPTDMVNSFSHLIVDADRFVRGDIISIGGSVELYGEVSRNIICLFGDITLHSKSVVRGDAVAVYGRVFTHEESLIYGQIVSQKGWQKGNRWFGPTGKTYREISMGVGADYNRVDGVNTILSLKYEDPKHLLPSASVGIGYAFMAKRVRYDLELSQRIFEYYSFEPYAKIYRLTATEDDWMCGKLENALMALIVNEDFRDYYEIKGSAIGIKFYLGPYNTFDFQYSFDRIGWLDAHPKLWSLFGKKDFRSNFSTLPYILKRTYQKDFDSKLSLFTFTYALDTRDNKDVPHLGWYGAVKFEKAGGDLKGDLTYSRWMVGLVRYQPLNHNFALNMRALYGGSSDRLPLFKKFFLGGPRTMRGYKPKLFYGDQFFLGNIEYVANFTDNLIGKLFFDGCKMIGQKDNLLNDGEFKSDVGIGLGYAPGFMVELSKALDDSDSDVKVWVTFEKAF